MVKQKKLDTLRTADVMAPCVLWIDEIEEGLAGRAGETGTTQRVLGSFLTWMAESNSRFSSSRQPMTLALCLPEPRSQRSVRRTFLCRFAVRKNSKKDIRHTSSNTGDYPDLARIWRPLPALQRGFPAQKSSKPSCQRCTQPTRTIPVWKNST